jgi:hypothetical protein
MASANDTTTNQQTTCKEPHPSDGFDLLPPGWTQIVVGNVANYHVASIKTNSPFVFDLVAAASGFSTNGDNALFVCRTNPGTEFMAYLITLTNLTTGDINSRNGIMLRESQEINSPFLFIGTSSKRIYVYRRDGQRTLVNNSVPVPDNTTAGIMYFKFDQTENGQYSAAYSFDFRQWFELSGLRLAVDSNSLVGFAQCSGNNEDIVRARFSDGSAAKKK